MINTNPLRASDGSGNAVTAIVNAGRSIGATTLKVNSVSKFPAATSNAAFIITTGTANAAGYLDPLLGPITEMRGHLSGSDIIIDGFEPGYTDVGNTLNQIVVIKQTSGWANLVQDSLAELQNETIIRSAQTTADFIQSGGTWTKISGLNASMTAVTAYQAGYRATLVAVSSRTFTASKDVYVDLLRGGTIINPIFTLIYTDQTNGGAVPVLASNSLRIAKIVTNATDIVSIQQSGYDTLNNRFLNTFPILPAQAPFHYEEIARLTLTAPSDLLTLLFPARKYLKLKVNLLATGGTIGGTLRYNNDAGVNYSGRFVDISSVNNVSVNQTSHYIDPSNPVAFNIFCDYEIVNYLTTEKHTHGWANHSGSVGASSIGEYRYYNFKYANTSQQITRIDIANSGTGDFAIGSEILLLGRD